MDLFTNMSLIFDIIAVLILILLISLHLNKGFLALLVEFIGTVATIIGSFFASKIISPWIYETFFRQGLQDSLTESLGNIDGNVDISGFVNDLLGFMPEAVRNFFAEDLMSGFTVAANSSGATIAENIMEEIIGPTFTPVIALLVFIVVFIILRILFGLLENYLMGLNDVPLLGHVNKVFGWILSVLIGLISLYLLLTLVWGVLLLSGNALPSFNEAALADSYVYGIFEKVNILTEIL